MEMKAVWEANKPSKDILSPSLSPQQFGIEISHVKRGEAPPVYQDPITFFKRTYLTATLSSILKDSILTVTHGSGNPIYVLLTSFGGGKTHILLSLYHFFTYGNKDEIISLPSMSKLKEELNLARSFESLDIHSIPPVKVVVIDGQNLDKDVNLFNYLADSLGVDVDLKDPTESKVAEVLKKAGPSVILVDEIGEYLRKLYVSKADDSKMQEVLLFFRFLTSAITGENRTFLLVTLTEETLPTSIKGYISELKKILSRYVSPREPASRDEVVEIIKTRLFESIDKTNADRVSSYFSKYYSKFKQYYPSEASQYYSKMTKYYPFHPMLIDTIYGRISTIPGFQQTRHALRFLAEVVRSVWRENRKDAYVIGLDSVNLSDPDVLNSLLSNIGREELSTVAKFDIESTEGGKAKNMGQDHLFTARVIFMGSIIGADSPPERNAFGRLEILLGVTKFNVNPGWIDNVLKELNDALWYIYSDGVDRFWFNTIPNINKAIEDAKTNVGNERIEMAREYLNQLVESFRKEFRNFKVSAEVSLGSNLDNEDLRVVILDPSVDELGLTINYKGGELTPPEKLKEHFLRRVYKNSAVFLVFNKREWDTVLDKASLLAAIERLERIESMKRFSKELKSKKSEYEAQLITSLVSFAFLFYPTLSETYVLQGEKVQSGQKDMKIDMDDLAKKAMEVLKERSKVIYSEDVVSDDYLKIMFTLKQDKVSVKEFMEDMTRKCDMPIVPMKGTIFAMIKRAISLGVISYKDAQGYLTNLREISSQIRKEGKENVDIVNLISEGVKIGSRTAEVMKSKFSSIDSRELTEDGFLVKNEEVKREISPFLLEVQKEIQEYKNKSPVEVKGNGGIDTVPKSKPSELREEKDETLTVNEVEEKLKQGYTVDIKRIVIHANNTQDFSGSQSLIGLLLNVMKTADPTISIEIIGKGSKDVSDELRLKLETKVDDFQRKIVFAKEIANEVYRKGSMNIIAIVTLNIPQYRIKENNAKGYDVIDIMKKMDKVSLKLEVHTLKVNAII